MFTSLSALLTARDQLKKHVREGDDANHIIVAIIGAGSWDELVAKIKSGEVRYSPDWIISAKQRFSAWMLDSTNGEPSFDKIFEDEAPVPVAALMLMSADDGLKLIAPKRLRFHFDCRIHRVVREQRYAKIVSITPELDGKPVGYDIELTVYPCMNHPLSKVRVDEWSAIVSSNGSPAFAHARGMIIRAKNKRPLTRKEALRAAYTYDDDTVSIMNTYMDRRRFQGQLVHLEEIHVMESERRRGIGSTLLACVLKSLSAWRKGATPTALLLDASKFSDRRYMPDLSDDECSTLMTGALNGCFARVIRTKVSYQHEIVVVPNITPYIHPALAASSAKKPPERSEDARWQKSDDLSGKIAAFLLDRKSVV
jgi:hypothetical protein